jgi:para-aminobenzoate synthetase component 1
MREGMTEKFENFIKRMDQMGKDRIPFLFIIDYERNNPLLFPLNDAAKNNIFFSTGNLRNYSDRCLTVQPLQFSKRPIDYAVYKDAFDKVMHQIRLGNTFLLNMTFRTEIKSNWSLREIFEKSQAPYKLLFQDQFAVFSPECFIKIANGKIFSFPMKGTIDASIPHASEVIARDGKETAEHATIVDLIRNDLSMVARDVEVTRYRYTEEVVAHDKTLLQVSSEISGILPPDYLSGLGTMLAKLLPAGSICGAPKESTLRIIRETENYSRGYYTGVFGVFDGSCLDSGVMIRFIEKTGEEMYFKSGGGITHSSDPEKEYRELIDKVYVAAH